jgi:hypothetical protein
MLLGAGAAYWILRAGAAYSTSCKLACNGEHNENVTKRSLANNTMLLYSSSLHGSAQHAM